MENANERIVFHANKVEKQMFTIVLPHDEDSIFLARSCGIFGKCKEKISTELYGNVSLEYSKEQLRLKSEVGAGRNDISDFHRTCLRSKRRIFITVNAFLGRFCKIYTDPLC